MRSDTDNLALSLWHQGKYAEADPFYRQAIEIDEKALGGDHPTVATLYSNLAALLYTQGKHGEAEPMFRRALEISQASLGSDHPTTLTIKKTYDELLQRMNNDEFENSPR